MEQGKIYVWTLFKERFGVINPIYYFNHIQVGKNIEDVRYRMELLKGIGVTFIEEIHPDVDKINGEYRAGLVESL